MFLVRLPHAPGRKSRFYLLGRPFCHRSFEIESSSTARELGRDTRKQLAGDVEARRLLVRILEVRIQVELLDGCSFLRCTRLKTSR